MKKSFAVIDIKSMDDEQRVIRGIATTPEIDRMGDSVNPMGVKVAKDIPLFLYHDSKLTVGRARLGKATKEGIPFEASIPKVQEDGRLKERVDEAWQMLKYQLITCVSIGFNVLNDAYERIKETGGYLFNEIEVLELSLVPVPAHAGAVITGLRAADTAMRRTHATTFIRSISDQHLAALGHSGSPPGDRHRPGASGQSQQPPSGGFFHSRSQKGNVMKTLKELLEQKTARESRQTEITKAWEQADHQRTDEERDELDAIDAELKSLDDDIRIARMNERHAANAKGVDGSGSERGTASRGGRVPGGMSFMKNADPDDAFKGQGFIRQLFAKAAAWKAARDGEFLKASDYAQKRWGRSNPQLVHLIKANEVAGGGTGSGEWGAELVSIDNRYRGDFVGYLYAQTVYDRLGLRPAPKNVSVKGQDGAATGYWVGESKAIPVSKPDFSTTDLTILKAAGITVASKELLADSDPAAEQLIRDSLVEAIAQRIDTTFLSTTAASAGVSPAGILNGVSALHTSGIDEAAVRAMVKSLYSTFITDKNSSGLKYVMAPGMAKAIGLIVNALGQTSFPGLGTTGGTLLGDPVVTGDNVDPSTVLLVKPSDIWLLDDGLQVSMSDAAMIEQNSAPTGATDTPTAASVTMVSMFQEDSVAIKVVRRTSYKKRRANAVAYVDDADFDGIVS